MKIGMEGTLGRNCSKGNSENFWTVETSRGSEREISVNAYRLELQRGAGVHRSNVLRQELFRNLNSTVATMQDFIRNQAIKDTSRDGPVT